MATTDGRVCAGFCCSRECWRWRQEASPGPRYRTRAESLHACILSAPATVVLRCGGPGLPEFTNSVMTVLTVDALQ